MSSRLRSESSLLVLALALLGGCAHASSTETTVDAPASDLSSEEQTALALREAGCTVAVDPDEATGTMLQCDDAGVRVRLPLQDWQFVPVPVRERTTGGILIDGRANQGLYTFTVARLRPPAGESFDEMAQQVFDGMLTPIREEQSIRMGEPTFENVGGGGSARLMSLPLHVTAEDGTPMLGDTFGFVLIDGGYLWFFAWSDWGTEASFDAQVHADNASLIDTIEFRD